MKNALLASIAHDLRSPLAAIRQLAEKHAAAARIGDETERIARYLDAVLAYVRSNEAAPRDERVHVADDLVGAAIRAAALTGREVRVSIPDVASISVAPRSAHVRVTTSRTSGGFRPSTQNRRGFTIPAFSAAIAGSVVPRYC